VVFTSRYFIDKNGGIFSRGQDGQRKPFVFGRPLVDDARVAPYAHAGLAAINARCNSNEAVIARTYGRLVDRFVKNIGARVNAGQVELKSAGAFMEEMKREAQDKNEMPHPDFVWDLNSAKHTSLFPIFIYDVASGLGVQVGVIAGKAEISLFVCGKGVRIENKHVKIGENLDSDKDANATIHDKAELQSTLYSMAANEKAIDTEFDLAISLFRKALALCPENADARCGAASAFAELGKNQKALAESQLASSLEPHLGRAHGLAGLALAKMGRNYDAIEKYLDAIVYADTDAKRAVYFYNIAISYFNVGQPNDAKNSCSKCISIEQNNADAFRLRSTINRELGMDKQADEDMRRYEKLTGGRGAQGKGNP